MAQLPELRADCSRCAGLCCVALAFDRSEHFAFDKPAGQACPHLSARYVCRIHAERTQRGFSGCANYDCLGAGQRVTQELFGGATWRNQPELALAMFDAFRALRQVHELLLLLQAARLLPLTEAHLRRVTELERWLSPGAGWSLDALRDLERGELPQQVMAFLRTLRGLIVASKRRVCVVWPDGAGEVRLRSDGSGTSTAS